MESKENTKQENKPLNSYNVRIKVIGAKGFSFLNGMVLCSDANEAKIRAKKVIEQKYKDAFLAKIEVVKCTKNKLDFFIKKQ